MSDYILCHHGIKGQKWGVRRFQKKDGSLTPAGKKRYGETWGKEKELYSQYKTEKKAAGSRAERKAAKKRYESNLEDLYDKNYRMKGDNLEGVLGTFNYYSDRHNFGPKGVARINDRMNAGDSYSKAYTKELVRTTVTGYAVATAILAAPAVATAATNSFKGYANEKAIQKAQKGLTRIGTFQYEHVAKNVYQKVMK